MTLIMDRPSDSDGATTLEELEMSAVKSPPTQTTRERLSCRGDELVGKIRKLIHEGNVRRIVIRHDGEDVMSMPVNVGVAGTLLAPWLAAIGALATFLGQVEVEVERDLSDDGGESDAHAK
jgi:Domain of unknown function (DUF4342)